MASLSDKADFTIAAALMRSARGALRTALDAPGCEVDRWDEDLVSELEGALTVVDRAVKSLDGRAAIAQRD